MNYCKYIEGSSIALQPLAEHLCGFDFGCLPQKWGNKSMHLLTVGEATCCSALKPVSSLCFEMQLVSIQCIPQNNLGLLMEHFKQV